MPSQSSILKNNWKWQARKNRNNGSQGAADYARLVATELWEKQLRDAKKAARTSTQAGGQVDGQTT